MGVLGEVVVPDAIMVLMGSFMAAITLGLIGWALLYLVKLGNITSKLQEQQASMMAEIRDMRREHDEMQRELYARRWPSNG